MTAAELATKATSAIRDRAWKSRAVGDSSAAEAFEAAAGIVDRALKGEVTP